MVSLGYGKLVGKGALPALAVALLLSNLLKTGLEGVFTLALLIFVSAGAIALLVRSGL